MIPCQQTYETKEKSFNNFFSQNFDEQRIINGILQMKDLTHISLIALIGNLLNGLRNIHFGVTQKV